MHVGGNDSGLRANGDGNVAFYAKNTKVAAWNNDRLQLVKDVEIDGMLNAKAATFGGNIHVSRGGRSATFHENGDVTGPIRGGTLYSWIEKRIHESTAFWVDGNNWWRKDFRAGSEFITQGDL